MKDFYDAYWKIRGKSGERPRYHIFFDWIEPKSKVLDLGCGDGYLGELLVKSKAAEYSGCDISGEALTLAKEKNLETLELDLEKDFGKFENKSFDYVVMSEFLEHTVEAEEILKKAGRIAKKGVLLSIPNIAYWPFRLQLLFGNFPKQWAVAPWEHLRFWSVADFIKTAENLGFKIRTVKSSNGRRILRDWWPNLFGFQVCFYLKPL